MTPAPNRRDRRSWWETYRRVGALSRRLGRLPKLSDGAPAVLVTWISNQRRATTLTSQQCVALESLPAWSWNPRQAAWIARAEELRLFIRATGRLPRVRDDGERALAHWYSRQHLAMQRRELPRHREVLLHYATRPLPTQAGPGPERGAAAVGDQPFAVDATAPDADSYPRS